MLMRKVDWAKAADELYAKDKDINAIEQSVRHRILTHLSVGNQQDLSACLMLMSVVKDAERIGDYCKNIFEVGKFYRRQYSHPSYAEPLEKIREGAVSLFDRAGKAFGQADADLAHETLETAAGLRKKCDLIIQELLMAEGQIPADEAVAYVLLARFYKRVAAHLANIATSVVSPVPMIDYRKKKT